jgi:hypothetical protein
MKIGFTGTRIGMTATQALAVRHELERLRPTEARHGDCVGADAQFHALVREQDATTRIVVHPPDNPKLRAFCQGDLELVPRDYQARNRDIVDAADVLLAAPRGGGETLRSGTWATIRRARVRGIPILICYPSGMVAADGEWRTSCVS